MFTENHDFSLFSGTIEPSNNGICAMSFALNNANMRQMLFLDSDNALADRKKIPRKVIRFQYALRPLPGSANEQPFPQTWALFSLNSSAPYL